jgi:hypothetical protein
MGRLRLSLVAFGGSLFVLCVSVRGAMLEGIGDAARGIIGAVDLVVSLGRLHSAAQTGPRVFSFELIK